MAGLEITHTITLPADPDLVAVLDALDVAYEPLAWGTRLEIGLNADLDGRLEQLIGRLSELRWGYQPGRAIQVTLPGLAALLEATPWP